MTYIVIPRLQVRNANAQPAWWMIGPPAMTAYAGFVHALKLKLGIDSILSFGVVHHDIQFLGETVFGDLHHLHPHQFRAAALIDKGDYSSKNANVLSSQPSARCHLEVSIVVRLPAEETFDPDIVNAFLRGGRLAGGSIVSHADISARGDIENVIRKIGTGFAIHERQDLMKKVDGDRDMLDVILRLTDPAANVARREMRDTSMNWLLPNTLGYLAISDFKERKNVRGGLPHAYAEPLVGLVQYKSIGTTGIPFWKMTTPDSKTFLLTTN